MFKALQGVFVWRNCPTKSLKKARWSASALQSRNYLSAAYQCQEGWDKRHQDELVKVVKDSNQYYIKIIHKLKTEYKIWPIDLDLYVHSLKDDGSDMVPDDLEYLLEKMRQGSETQNTLKSTWHAILRLMCKTGNKDSLFRIMQQPITYGVFPQQYTTALLIDHYLVEKDYTSAMRVVWRMMLEEDFYRPLHARLGLLTCLQYASSGDSCGEWRDYTPAPPPEPEDDVKVRVSYIVNPYFDDHFHLKENHLVVGKSLVVCSEYCKRNAIELGGDTHLNTLLLGHTMWRKWDTVAQLIKQYMAGTKTEAIAELTVTLMTQHITEFCPEEEVKAQLLAAVEGLPVSAEFDLVQVAEAALKQVITDTEAEEIALQETAYEETIVLRAACYEHQQTMEENVLLEAEIKLKKKDLKAKQQRIMYFDNENEVHLLLDQIGKFEHPFPRERPRRYCRNKKVTVDEDYIPPMIR